MITFTHTNYLSTNIKDIPSFLFIYQRIASLIKGYMHSVGMLKRFRPRLYDYSDYVLVKLYAITLDKSIHIAAEELNTYFTKKYKQSNKRFAFLYADRHRRRRYVPHQTDIDKFFRLLTENETKMLFGNILMEGIKYIQKFEFRNNRLRYLVDKTKYPYYGKNRTPHEIGTLKLPGTRVCRMIQGHALHGFGMHLFFDFSLLQKGKYRAAALKLEIKWAHFNGIKVDDACMDREFYRVNAVRDLYNEGVAVILPAKMFAKVRKAIVRYLITGRYLVSPYRFMQTKKKGRWRNSIKVNLCIVGHDDQSAAEVRKKFKQRKLTFTEALKQLAGFFTTISPWGSQLSCCKFIARTYKKRWNIETGFAKLNCIHESFQNTYPVVMLAETYLRALIYNNWQFWRKNQSDRVRRNVEASLKVYKSFFEMEVKALITYILNFRNYQRMEGEKY